jgi:hypothetical protein
MSESQQTAATGGVGFAGLLTLVFIVLKLCHVIDWKWVWVLSPLWISVSISVLVIILVVLVGIWMANRR